ncbi:unnamed protein product [Rotaria socialis]|uniref:Uncharacterized protein n=2 Tax=Rotaria socialis TaxID=392032 RepID=A0A818AL05_9BILA|nr:unnamed protein product [Rotaria socialis]CAF3405437.1 unnamed protein product [Rotaria socialis]CAF4221539.1 unnamed protein product [Rotaria socialis]CAF4483052.1 unnamed protein product [Rotaria socialis]CAF4816672.1 unnamed protein product [Rotaria socialis]
MFTNLQYFHFDPFLCYQRISFWSSPSAVFSSTLCELRVKVMHTEDCLYLLDGRFNQLRTFFVNIGSSATRSALKINKGKLPNLRCFSFLYLSLARRNGFIDGNDLKQNINNYLPRLNQFRFNIRSIMLLKDQIDLLSNKDIQHSFKDFFLDTQIIFCANYFLEQNEDECYIYSYPYKITRYENIEKNFPGRLFTRGFEVSLFDEHSLEHEFFIQIVQSFPFMRSLTLANREAQNDKQCRKLEK